MLQTNERRWICHLEQRQEAVDRCNVVIVRQMIMLAQDYVHQSVTARTDVLVPWRISWFLKGWERLIDSLWRDKEEGTTTTLNLQALWAISPEKESIVLTCAVAIRAPFLFQRAARPEHDPSIIPLSSTINQRIKTLDTNRQLESLDADAFQVFRHLQALREHVENAHVLKQQLNLTTFTERSMSSERGSSAVHIFKFRRCVTDILELLEVPVGKWQIANYEDRHEMAIEAVQGLKQKRQSIDKQLVKALRAVAKLEKLRPENIQLEKNSTAMSKRLKQKEQALLEVEERVASSQAYHEQRTHEKDQFISSLNNKIDTKAKEIQDAKAEVDKVKAAWQKKLQTQFDKVATLERTLKIEVDAHNVTKLDMETR